MSKFKDEDIKVRFGYSAFIEYVGINNLPNIDTYDVRQAFKAAISIEHLETGAIAFYMQSGSQIINKQKAMKILEEAVTKKGEL